ncbi:hypothetical protein [Nocardioides bruguierae]|uniref:Uncharacterized protein n=1 Tax=Nocardioides bruguierae TaxID=2945102 RepID=A0A9X2DB93_9ACTN|nr:hypothetical protein [Nocardioides bruguierae]MCM0622429.1 hypothetical protein [Nocardioides bruguierae]
MSSTPESSSEPTAVVPPRPETGVAAVDAVLADVARLDETDPETGETPGTDRHAAVYDSAHSRLRRALDTDPDAPVWTGPRPDVAEQREEQG